MTTRRDNSRVIKAPTGPQISAKSWLTEAPLRMLMNNLDPGVAERPEELVVYGGIGRAARNWEAFDTIVASLRSLGEEETLLVQSGKPVGIFRTHKDAPRVLIANSNLVPHWGTWEKFHELDRKGLMMYGQMTAGSWIYIGTQGIVQGTYETFAEVGRKHYGGNLKGKWFLTAGLGGMGGAQPLAATMAGVSMIAIECQPSRIEMRLKTRYLDTKAATIAEALEIVDRSHKAGKPVSVGLLGNAAELLPEIVAKGIKPDALTDQTSAHDPINGYLPAGWTLAEWEAKRVSDPKAVEAAAMASMKVHVQAMLDLYKAGVPTLDYGNNIRQMAFDMGLKDAFAFPGFVPAYIRPLFCRGIGPFRWAALSGNPDDIYKTDQRVKELIPDDPHLHNWLDMARERIAFQGLPARICWVGLGQRHRLGLAFNEMVKNGEVDAPIVIGRDHLDSGSVASPNRETEAMLDGSDAVSDWPLLNALLNTASGATWVSIHHGGGVGIGYSQHAGMVVVADGSDDAARRLERVLWNDPASGVMRHADAGYDIAIQCAKENGLNSRALGSEIMHYDPRNDPCPLPLSPFKSCTVPRPIGWLSTISTKGIANLAPYSQWQNLTFDPPMVMFAANQHIDGRRKDTVVNAEETGWFVWNMATFDLREAVNITAVPLPHGVDEFATAGVTKAACIDAPGPRVAESPCHFECRYLSTQRLRGASTVGTVDVVFGEVARIHVRDDVVLANGKLDIAKIRPIARMGYFDYAVIDNVFEMIIPDEEALAGLEGRAARDGG